MRKLSLEEIVYTKNSIEKYKGPIWEPENLKTPFLATLEFMNKEEKILFSLVRELKRMKNASMWKITGRDPRVYGNTEEYKKEIEEKTNKDKKLELVSLESDIEMFEEYLWQSISGKINATELELSSGYRIRGSLTLLPRPRPWLLSTPTSHED